MAAKSASASLPSAVTRKVGPAPVWVWVVAAVLMYTLYQRFGGAGASAAVSPSPNVQASGQTAGDGGMGNGSGGLTADLLASLGQFGTHDAYNSWSWSSVDSHDTTTTSSIDYGTGNTYPGDTYRMPLPSATTPMPAPTAPSAGSPPGVGGLGWTPPPGGYGPAPGYNPIPAYQYVADNRLVAGRLQRTDPGA